MAEQRSASRRILLVDDDDAIRCLVRKVLEPYGYVVTGATSGKEGDFRIVYGSPNHKDILEYDPAVLIGQSWLNFVHPDDRKQSEHALRRLLADGITDRKVIRFRNRLN